MDKLVTSNVQKAMKSVFGNAKVQTAFQALEKDQDRTRAELKELVAIEAPTFHEEKRAKVYAEKLSALGLIDVHIDQHGNVLGRRPGTGNGPVILVEGHLDTVFPAGTDLTPVEKEGKIYAPGIGDDTMALAGILSILRAMNEAKIETVGDLLFAGTAGEEGLGGMNGMKGLLEDHPEIAASVSIDGASECDLVYNATGIINYEVTYTGPGGHAYSDFGTPSPLHAAARAVAKIADLKPPIRPKTTYTVSFIEGGHAIHAIAQKAMFKINMRSDDKAELEKLTRKVETLIEAGAAEENAAWGKNLISVQIKKILDIPAGSQPQDALIVQTACAAVKSLGKEPRFISGGCTNGNRAIAAGIPAVTLGRGERSGGVHTLEEWFDPTGAYVALQNILLVFLALAGVKDITAPLVAKK